MGTSQACTSGGGAYINLDVNNVSVGLRNSGDFWWNGIDGRYIAPKSDPGFAEVSAIFAGAIWMGGVSPTGDLKLAAQTYRSGGNSDFFPGPLDFFGAPIENGCEDWDRFWVVDRSVVEAHQADFADNGIIDEEREQIFGWPARGSTTFFDVAGFELPDLQRLAPFFDTNGNGIYEAEQGDYPLIKGDKSIWWVFNDAAGPHEATNGEALNFEVHAMAYAYADEVNVALDNTTFYDFTIISKANEAMTDVQFGLWVDFDLGCYEDDYVGYDSTYQMLFVYNEDAVDGNPGTACTGGVNTYGSRVPMLGIKKIDADIYPVTSVSAISGAGANPPPGTTDPQSAPEYYNYLKGLWRDGSPMVAEGTGYLPTSSNFTKFMYSGEPSDENAWTMCSADLPLADRRSLMSSSMGTVLPGQVTTHSYAVVFVEDVPHPCPSLDMLREAVDAACDALDTATEDIEQSDVEVLLTPNPTSDILTISSPVTMVAVAVHHMDGRELIRESVTARSEHVISLAGLPVGMYLIAVSTSGGDTALQKVIVAR